MGDVFRKLRQRALRKQLRSVGASLPKDKEYYRRTGCILVEERCKFSDVTFGTMEQGLLEPLQLGAYSYMGRGRIEMTASIGRYCSIAKDVVIGMDPNQHPQSWLSTHPFQYEGEAHGSKDYARIWDGAVIGNDVWIGEGALIMKGVTIGHGAIIGAHSIVTKHVPPYAIVVGTPATILRYRFSDSICDQLLKLKWWRYSPSQLTNLSFHDVDTAINQLLKLSVDTDAHTPKSLKFLFNDAGIAATRADGQA